LVETRNAARSTRILIRDERAKSGGRHGGHALNEGFLGTAAAR
jgi:hypothetical protein